MSAKRQNDLSSNSFRTDLHILYALSHADIAGQVTPSTLSAAEMLYQQHAVFEAQVEGPHLSACVAISDRADYLVDVWVENGELNAECECNYDGDGLCAHAGAVLLQWVHNRKAFESLDEEEDDGLDEFLDEVVPLDQDAVIAVLEQALEDEYRQILAQQTVNELREIAQKRGIHIEGTRKEPIVEALATRLCDPQSIQAEMSRLKDLGKELLAHIHLTVSPGYGTSIESITPFERTANYNPQAVRSQITEMGKRGLLLSFKQGSVNYYVLPLAVRQALPPFADLVPACPAKQVQSLQVRSQPSALFIQKLFLLCNYTAEHRLLPQVPPKRLPIEDQWPHLQGWTHLPSEMQELASRGQFFYTSNQSATVPPSPYRLNSQDRQEVRQALGFTDEETEFYYALLSGVRIITQEADHPLQVSQDNLHHILDLSPSQQLAFLALAWKTLTSWQEMEIVLRSSADLIVRRSLTYTTYKPEHLREEWREGRMTITRLLSLLAEDRWLSLNGLLRAIHETTPDLLHQRSHPAVWWLESPKRKKQFGTTFDDWNASVGQFILATLQGSLFWIGAVDLGYQDGKLQAIRLTPAGAFINGKRASLSEDGAAIPVKDTIRFGNDLTVELIPSRVPIQLNQLLHTMAQLEEATSQRFIYRLTPSSVQRAFEAGQTDETLIAALEKLCQARVPSAWQDRLQTWHRNYGKLHLYEGITLIELADEYALQELMLNTSLRDHMVYQFSPRLVAIRPEAVDTLVQEMEKRGYTPRVEAA